MKRLFLMLALIFTISTVAAQQTIVINSEKVFKSIAAYNQAISELDQLAEQYQTEVNQKFEAVEFLYNEYMKVKGELNQAQRKRYEEAILIQEQQAKEFQESLFGKDGSLMKQRLEKISPIQKRVFGAIEAYAQRIGADVVMDSANNPMLLYTKPSIDHTDAVIKTLK